MPSATPPDHHVTTPPPVPVRRSAEWWVRKAISLGLFLVVGVALIAALGLAQRMGWISAGGSGGAVTAEAGDQIYTCPMHPQIRQPSPGRCPICGMELVPSQSGGEQLDELAVRIEPAQRRLAQIETAEVQRAPIVSEIRSIGSIAIDESRMATISSYIAGRIEQLFADYTGVEVAEGDHLAIVYSPELYERQVQYVEARRAFAELSDNALPVVRETQQKLVENTRQRLVELGMTEEQLLELEETKQAQSRLTIHALFGSNHASPEEDADIQIGTVIEKLAVEGDYIDAGEPIYRIADLSTVWLMLELFPEDAARIRFGQRVTANIQSLPGEEFTGRVAFIDRTVDTQRRTVGVRVEFLNDDGRLRPGDYATAMIEVPIGQQGEVYDADLAGKWISPMHPQIITDEPGQCPICGMDLVPTSRYGYSDSPVPQPESLFVPRSAVLMAGNNSVVYVETETGRFEIRVVTLGPILRDRVVILDGLEEGDNVATAGNFLIDSQMQLAGNPSLIDPTRAIAAQAIRNEPLDFEEVNITAIPGETGQRLEDLYAVYTEIQAMLADDTRPTEATSQRLHQLASELATSEELTEAAHEQLAIIRDKSEHLHHLELDAARLEAFRPISHAVVTLATLVRGNAAEQPATHMFCPMVDGGEGDWLQLGNGLSQSDLRNPYFGSEMPKCGEVVQQFPLSGPVAKPSESAAPNETQP